MTSGTEFRFTRRRGFTLVELLLVIGIIGLLMGLLLPAVTRAYGRSVRLRTQADLAAISTALEAYKSDWGSYPVVTTANTGAAVLGKALIGNGDAAHFYTGTIANPTFSSTVLNPPTNTYSASTVYNAGDIVTTGGSIDVDKFLSGVQTSIYVCVRNDTQANGTAQTPTSSSLYWAPYLPYDGQDGAGAKIRLGAVPDGTGRNTTAVGKTYGPYLDVDRFKTRGTTLLDRNDCPILYFPINPSADPQLANGLAIGTTYPPPANTRPMINVNDNLGPFVNELSDPPASVVEPTTRIQIMLGDYNANGKTDPSAPVNELRPPKVAFLLWTAGADRRFGPAGQNRTGGTDWRRGDILTTTASPEAPGLNKASADACDDVTNFQND